MSKHCFLFSAFETFPHLVDVVRCASQPNEHQLYQHFIHLTRVLVARKKLSGDTAANIISWCNLSKLFLTRATRFEFEIVRVQY